MRRPTLRRIAGAALCMTVVAAPPPLLLSLLGAPSNIMQFRPHSSWRYLDAGDVRVMVLYGCGLLLWCCWLRLSIALVVEAVRRMRGPSARERLHTGPTARLATLLIGGVIGLAPQVSTPAASATPPSPFATVALDGAGIRLGWAESGFVAAVILAAAGVRRRARRRRDRSPARSGTTQSVGTGRLRELHRCDAPEPAAVLAALWACATGGVTVEAQRRPSLATLSASGEVTVWFVDPAPDPPNGWIRTGANRWLAGPEVAARATPSRPDGVPHTAESRALVQIGHSVLGSVHIPGHLAAHVAVDGPTLDAQRIHHAFTRAAGVTTATIAAGPSEAPVVDDCAIAVVHDGRTWMLQPFGLALHPIGLEVHDLGEVRTMLEGAGQTEPLTPEGPSDVGVEQAKEPWGAPVGRPVDLEAPLRSRPTGPQALPTLPEWVFVVRVLGPVDVLDHSGQSVSFERGRSVELLAWLALHRRSATREAARAALWESEVRDSSFANVVSEARRALARHIRPQHGAEWLTRPHGERLGLHDAVVCDIDLLELFCARAAAADRAGAAPDAAIDELRQGLELVRGAPFVGSGFGWADSEAITTDATLLVVRTAVDLAERELRVADIEGVFWATGIGLSVLPGHEELVALRLRAHALAGDSVGVRHEWQTYLRSLARDSWQSEPSEWLESLVHELLGDRAVA